MPGETLAAMAISLMSSFETSRMEPLLADSTIFADVPFQNADTPCC